MRSLLQCWVPMAQPKIFYLPAEGKWGLLCSRGQSAAFADVLTILGKVLISASGKESHKGMYILHPRVGLVEL